MGGCVGAQNNQQLKRPVGQPVLQKAQQGPEVETKIEVKNP